MARANAKKHDSPTIAMRIERGHLVPVSAYDQELMQQWREGAELNVDVSMVKVRPLEKRYFAMLSHLLKAADTPWSNTDTAHEAIKLATGFVTPVRRKTGEWGKPLSRHIASFDDTELEEYFELFCGIVRKRFGIDPDELRKAAPESESSGADSKSAADDGPGDETIPPVVGEPSPGDAPPGEPEAGGDDMVPRQQPPPADGSISAEDYAWLKMAARMLVSASGDDLTILDMQRQTIKRTLTPDTISTRARAIAAKIYELCWKGTPDQQTKKMIAHWAGCEVADLRPEAR